MNRLYLTGNKAAWNEMARVRTEFLEEDMILGEDLYSSSGKPIAAKGSPITKSMIQDFLDNNQIYVEVANLSESDVDKIYNKVATEEEAAQIHHLHSTQFSLCVDDDRYVQELKKISLRALYISLRR